jgi:hypothetical protein
MEDPRPLSLASSLRRSGLRRSELEEKPIRFFRFDQYVSMCGADLANVGVSGMVEQGPGMGFLCCLQAEARTKQLEEIVCQTDEVPFCRDFLETAK